MPPEVLATIAAAFLVAGLVKGVIGLGLPTVSLALLTATLDIKQAIALMLIPALLTNIWQALDGTALRPIIRRLWSLLAGAGAGIWLGTALLARSDSALVAGLFGLLLCAYAAYSLVTPQIRPPGRHEAWMSPSIGILAGTVTGLTGSFVVPGVLYLQALGLKRDVLIQAMGVAFTFLTATLAIAMASHNLVPANIGLISAFAVVPTVLGMAAGQKLRRRLPEIMFRRVFFCALFALGFYICVQAVI